MYARLQVAVSNQRVDRVEPPVLRSGLIIETRLDVRGKESWLRLGIAHNPVIAKGQDMVRERTLSRLKAISDVCWVDTPRRAYRRPLARIVEGYIVQHNAPPHTFRLVWIVEDNPKAEGRSIRINPLVQICRDRCGVKDELLLSPALTAIERLLSEPTLACVGDQSVRPPLHIRDRDLCPTDRV